MSPLEKIGAINEDPAKYLKRLKAEQARWVLGYVCSYTPEELIIAAGAHPVRVLGTRETVNLADGHLQSYCCSLVRGILEEGLSGRLSCLDGMVFPHTCDSIQRLSDIWRMNIPQMFHFDIVWPVKLHTISARDYFIDVLARFKRELEEKLSVRITDEALRGAIGVMNDFRRRFAAIYAIRYTYPGSLSGSELWAVMRAVMVMDKEEAFVMLGELGELMKSRPDADIHRPGKRILLAGGVCNLPDVYAMIEEAGGFVVWDDFCSGARYFDGLADESGDPLEAIAKRYLKRVVCPAKHRGLFDRAEHLIRLAGEKGIQGVVMVLMKFCDPHAFDYPYLKNVLEKGGLPVMLLEVEDPIPPRGQLLTRLEAFLEMI